MVVSDPKNYINHATALDKVFFIVKLAAWLNMSC